MNLQRTMIHSLCIHYLRMVVITLWDPMSTLNREVVWQPRTTARASNVDAGPGEDPLGHRLGEAELQEALGAGWVFCWVWLVGFFGL